MTTKRIESWAFRLVGTQAHEVYLEFDGLLDLEYGLKAFVKDWATSHIRPTGTCFTVIAQGRDFASLMNWGPGAPTIPVPLGSFLLLRVDTDHPYFGERTPGWVLVRPNSDRNQQPEYIGYAPDEPEVPITINGPQGELTVGP